MRSLLIAATLLLSAPLRAGVVTAPAPAAADWHRAELNDGMRDALRGAGYRLEDDGRVLDPQTHQALSSKQLSAALTRINLDTQRLALERLNILLAKNPPDLEGAKALKGNLPQSVAAALDANKDLAGLRAAADRSLADIAAYFDGTRTAAERREAATPVLAGAPGPRVSLPYFDPAEKALGDSLRAAAAAKIGADPYGRKVLARLNGADGKPDLPPIVVEDLGGAAAEYDYRRQALVVDRQSVMSAVADGVPAKDRGALAKSLSSRKALVDYLNAHPEAVAAFTAKNDVLLVHELTHAWQDRRDPVMREMARGSLPHAIVIDYEIEAWTEKNLYLHSVLTLDPGAAVDDAELQDYQRMAARHGAWVTDLRRAYEDAAVNAMDLRTAEEVQRARLELAKKRATATRDEQNDKALDLAAMTRAQRELSRTAASEKARLDRLAAGPADAVTRDSAGLLARHYLEAALDASGPVDFSVLIKKAEDFAVQSGDKTLLAKIRSLEGRRR